MLKTTTLHDPSHLGMKVAMSVLGLPFMKDGECDYLFSLIERLPSGYHRIGRVLFSWTEPDCTGMTPLHIIYREG